MTSPDFYQTVLDQGGFSRIYITQRNATIYTICVFELKLLDLGEFWISESKT